MRNDTVTASWYSDLIFAMFTQQIVLESSVNYAEKQDHLRQNISVLLGQVEKYYNVDVGELPLSFIFPLLQLLEKSLQAYSHENLREYPILETLVPSLWLTAKFETDEPNIKRHEFLSPNELSKLFPHVKPLKILTAENEEKFLQLIGDIPVLDENTYLKIIAKYGDEQIAQKIFSHLDNLTRSIPNESYSEFNSHIEKLATNFTSYRNNLLEKDVLIEHPHFIGSLETQRELQENALLSDDVYKNKHEKKEKVAASLFTDIESATKIEQLYTLQMKLKTEKYSFLADERNPLYQVVSKTGSWFKKHLGAPTTWNELILAIKGKAIEIAEKKGGLNPQEKDLFKAIIDEPVIRYGVKLTCKEIETKAKNIMEDRTYQSPKIR